MIERIIGFSVRNKFVISIFVLGIIVWGIESASRLPLDAVPDITNNQVQIITRAPILAPPEIEQYITFPIEIAMANLPGVRTLCYYGRVRRRYGHVLSTPISDGTTANRTRRNSAKLWQS